MRPWCKRKGSRARASHHSIRSRSHVPGYAQQPGCDSGLIGSWKRIVVCRLLSHDAVPALISPDVRYQLKGHQSCVGQDESSEGVQRPQWQFSIV